MIEKGVSFEVETSGPLWMDATAYVYVFPLVHGVGDVHIVRPNFNTQPLDNRARIVLHELTHHVAGTEDHAYAWQSDFNSLTQTQQLDNADSIAVFARQA